MNPAAGVRGSLDSSPATPWLLRASPTRTAASRCRPGSGLPAPSSVDRGLTKLRARSITTVYETGLCETGALGQWSRRAAAIARAERAARHERTYLVSSPRRRAEGRTDDCHLITLREAWPGQRLAMDDATNASAAREVEPRSRPCS